MNYTSPEKRGFSDFENVNDCIFCKIANGEMKTHFVYKDEDIVAFRDINPKAPVHVLVVPIRHITSLQDVDETDGQLVAKLMLTVKKIADNLGISSSGYKLVMNNGKGAGQLVFHLHVHLLGGWQKSAHWQV